MSNRESGRRAFTPAPGRGRPAGKGNWTCSYAAAAAMGDDHETFTIPPFALRSGLTLDASAFLAYKTYGTLNDDRSNAILGPG